MTRRSGMHRATGAELLEVAVGMPLFVAALLILLWLGLAMNDDSGLRSAVDSAADLAVTRADSVLMGFDPTTAAGQGLIAPVQRYLQGGSFEELKPLLASDNLPAEYNAEEMYTRWVREYYPGATLRDMPAQTLYALIYVYEAMRQTAGPRLRYPCSPLPDARAGLRLPLPSPHGSGCLRCEPLSREELALAGCPGEGCPSGLLGPHGVPADRFGLRCYFRSDAGVAAILAPLLDLSDSPQLGLLHAENWRFLPQREVP